MHGKDEAWWDWLGVLTVEVVDKLIRAQGFGWRENALGSLFHTYKI